VAYYLQALVPQAMPLDTIGAIGILTQMFDRLPSVTTSLASLAAVTVGALWWASRVVEDREYVLEQ